MGPSCLQEPSAGIPSGPFCRAAPQQSRKGALRCVNDAHSKFHQLDKHLSHLHHPRSELVLPNYLYSYGKRTMFRHAELPLSDLKVIQEDRETKKEERITAGSTVLDTEQQKKFSIQL